MKKSQLFIIWMFSLLVFFPAVITNAGVPDLVLKQKDAVVTILIYENDQLLASGSGFIIDSNGTIATNYHVLSILFKQPHSAIAIKMANGKFIKAQNLLSIDEDKDIALIKVEGNGLPSIRVAKDNRQKQGDEVFVIGSPYGLETTITNGIISSIRGVDEFLQITAPISVGSSGSPVFNSNGEAIGIATLILQGGQNLNFAIPVKYITDIKQPIETSKTKTLKIATPPPALKSVAENKVNSVDEHIRLAKEYLMNDREEDAFNEYTKAIALSPANAFLYFAKALTALFRVIDLPPAVEGTAADIENEKAKKDNAKIYNFAIENYSKAIALQPDNVSFYFARAKAYIENEEYKNAVKDLDAAISLEPNISLLYSERCDANNELKLYENAINDCTKAIDLKPDVQNRFLLYMLPFKELGFSQDELKKRMRSFDAKLALANLYNKRASIYKKNGKINEAIKDYQKSVILHPSRSWDLYNLYSKEGRLDEDAVKFFSNAITVYPLEVSLYSHRGDIYKILKQYDKAIKDYTKAIELCPKCDGYYSSRAELYGELKQYDKAIKDYTAAIASDTEGIGIVKHMYYSARGEIYLKQGEKQKALNDFMKACELKDSSSGCEQVQEIKKDLDRGDKWVKYSKSSGKTFYYDKTSIKQLSKNNIMVWSRFEVDDVAAYIQEIKDKGLPEKYEDISYGLMLDQIDCENKQLGSTFFANYDTKGNVIDSSTIKSKMTPIVPDSVGETYYKTVCSKKKK